MPKTPVPVTGIGEDRGAFGILAGVAGHAGRRCRGSDHSVRCPRRPARRGPPPVGRDRRLRRDRLAPQEGPYATRLEGGRNILPRSGHARSAASSAGRTPGASRWTTGCSCANGTPTATPRPMPPQSRPPTPAAPARSASPTSCGTPKGTGCGRAWRPCPIVLEPDPDPVPSRDRPRDLRRWWM